METLKVKENFKVFGIAAIIYALIYVICMFDNGSGVAYPVFVTCTFVFIFFCMKKLGVKLRKGSYFYIVSIMLIAIATFCTDDGRIIFLNKIAVFFLVITFVLHTAYDMDEWNLEKYILSVITVLCLSIGEIIRPFSDAIWYLKNKMDKRSNKIFYALAGTFIALPLFMLIFALLSSADAIFGEMSKKMYYLFSFGNIFLMGIMFTFMFMMSYCILAFMEKRNISKEVKDTKTGEPFLAIPVVFLLSVMYIVFSGIQIASLFLRKMQLPESYTYASYAREGFFQLLLVSMINLVIVIVCLYRFKENKLLKGLLIIMSLCTFIMIASSAMRMILYIQYYHLTFLRIFVLWSLLVLTFIFTGVLISIIKADFPILKYSVIVITCLYVGLSFSHPDYWIAKVNIEGMKEQTNTSYDYYFLTKLNTDAAPVLIDYMIEEGYCIEEFYENEDKYSNIAYNKNTFGYEYLRRIEDRAYGNVGRRFNLSRYIGQKYYYLKK
ncbi:MAG: DUF4173 domain-containing protein [Lachnospiraceae bacterium]|nr:DUF4173 domain-containing protein [Lachnospiraceae bacterium]